MEVYGTISYASQEPWVFSGTVRENILFGQPFCGVWYNTVIKACALDKVKTNEYFLTLYMSLPLFNRG